MNNIISAHDLIDVVYTVDLNFATFVILLCIYLNSRSKLNRKLPSSQYLSATTILLLGQLFIESFTYFLCKIREPSLIPLTVFLYTFLYLVAPATSFIFMMFIQKYIDGEKAYSKTKTFMMAFPALVTLVLLGTNVFTGLCFRITTDNAYSRGPAFNIATLITVTYLIGIVIFLFIHRKKLTTKEYWIFNFFAIFPLLGGLAQTFFFGILVMWDASAFSIIVIYIYLQANVTKLDSLTKANSRSSFETYLDGLNKDSIFSLAFIDLDDFKSINDKFGHAEGDIALKNFSYIVQNTIDKHSTLARYGGDEFVICFNYTDLDKVKETLDRITEEVTAYNKKIRKPYEVKFSYGYDAFDNAKYITPTHLLKTIDTQMYEHKLNKKLVQYTKNHKSILMHKENMKN
ncbi:MAG: diguanylate cyclase [Clostridia bacterium]